ncbi:MAG: 1-(5-phosphoribosyl)-5-[(5-phosphoribosylamino)methylideneamino]imidazole-4-carboxamide isomerase [Rickettsiales bacterium]|nr:1-(5-phosphoribosyl)-5-[(5-phosphoribosylamino)methylideneamino]imidazole-4-carboxamide isomerase [Rickettsiales bacterium]
MKIYPAIDLKDGACVRLLRGNMEQATVFNESPQAQAQQFGEQGFGQLHLVDLNGAFEGRAVNEDAVKAVLDVTDVPVQLGGGIRTMADVERWLDAGISRVIIGTQAVREPAFVKAACKAFPGQIAVGIDAKGGMVAVEGWGEVTDKPAVELAMEYEDAGVAVIIYTDINRDGAMQGPNIPETVALAEKISTPVICSGGVSSLNDLISLKAFANKGIDGAIVGRAFYDGAIDPAEAIRRIGN